MRGGAGEKLRGTGLALASVSVLLLTGCELKDDGDNLVAGKEAFVQRCGSCHTLQRAGTTGVTGPNLDEAFQQARRDGFGESTFSGLVHGWIKQPNPNPQVDPASGEALAAMPADLVTGETAQDVAAYVATAAGAGGEDEGALAAIGVERPTEVAQAENGRLEIPADPQGGLVYTFGAAEADAGTLVVRSPNPSSVDHNIAVEGNGVQQLGPVVKNGGVSELEVTVQAGDYTFFCSVPGHRQGGMEGKLTVE